MTRRWRLAATTAAVALMCSAPALASCGSATTAEPSALQVKLAAATDGEATTLAAFSGTPIVVNLWSTWCTACVKEMPAFNQVAEQRGSAVHIIGVNVGDTAASAVAYTKARGVTFPQYSDPDGNLSIALSVTGLPSTAFVSAAGDVLAVHTGAFTADELNAEIDKFFPGL